LHFGSLIAALGSYADARKHDGTWLVRLEDLDHQREAPGAADHILRTLDAFGFQWDGPVLFQSRRFDAYAAALERLRAEGLTFPCTCSRKDIAQAGKNGPEGPVYPGTCRRRRPPVRSRAAIRLRTETPPIGFDDRIQGPQVQNIQRAVGDFVLRRADGVHAYQLAVVVDDAHQGINQIVRGADLVLSTPRQILLQRLLGFPTPVYAHLPLALDDQGRKLSKSEAAAPVDASDPLPSLERAWSFLAQPPFDERPMNIEEFWQHALARWDGARVPGHRCTPASSAMTRAGDP
jgi:glutamyl-Q tRNA(Asp) synthetase